MEITVGTIARGIFVRALFLCHSLVYTWRVVAETDNNLYWFLALIQVVVLVEAAITLKVRKTGEWQWFTPCVFLYLCNVVPCIWLLEFHLLNERLDFKTKNNLTICDPPEGNETAWLEFYDIPLPVSLTDESWALALQQSLLFWLIVGRWILPRGYLTHEKLSNLLLINIGMAADIVEFLAEGVQRNEVKCNKQIIVIVVTIWSVSILQFPFQWDTRAFRKLSIVSTLTRGNDGANCLTRCFTSTDVWGILSIILMQDGPFLIMRLYLLYLFGVSDQALVFFMAKNVLVLLLQFYRLWALLCLEWDEEGRVSWKFTEKIRSFRRTIRNLGGGGFRRRDQERSRQFSTERVESQENQFRVVDTNSEMADKDTAEIYSNPSFTTKTEE